MTDKPEHIGLDSKTQSERDRIDLGHEQSGVNVGRIQRFLSSAPTDLYGDSLEKKKQEHATNMLLYLLENDPIYAAAYHRLEDTLNNAQQAVDKALLDIKQRLAESIETLQKMEDQAAQLDDGTKVFLDNQGNLLTQDGKHLTAEEKRNIRIPEGAPSWEEYQTEKQRCEHLLRQQEELRRYEQDVLDPVDHHMHDETEPPSLEEIEEYERRIRNEMPPSAKAYFSAGKEMDVSVEIENRTSVAESLDDNKKSPVIDLATAFSKVNTDIPDDLPLPGLPSGGNTSGFKLG